MRRYFVVLAALALAVVHTSNALAQFTASVYQTTGTYTAVVSTGASAWTGNSSVGTGSGNFAFGSGTGVPGYGDSVIFSLSTDCHIGPSGLSSASIGGTAYITWKITGPTSSSPYEVRVKLGESCNNIAYANSYHSADYAYGHASGPIGSATQEASGANDYPDDYNDPHPSEFIYESVTIGTDGIGYLTVPFIGQSECQASGVPTTHRTFGGGYFDFEVKVLEVVYL